jgi:hypothetical protein
MYANLIRQAFATNFDAQKCQLNFEGVRTYVKDNGPDRRYTLVFNAACTSGRSAIVTYRGCRMYVDVALYPTTEVSVRVGQC